MAIATTSITSKISLRYIFNTWWPLAFSWLLMGIELPGVSAIIARMPNPEINLAAYGGVVFPLALIIEAPIIMLLAASTALSKDWDSYHKIRTFMLVTSTSLTALHILVAFTPLYYFVVESILGVPKEIVEPAHIGLQIMTPWTFSIAYRRFNQGVLIRFGHSRAIGAGTIVRLITLWLILLTGYTIGNIPGIIVGSAAVAFGVMSEAIYVSLVVRPVIRGPLQQTQQLDTPLTKRAFLEFYIPLAMTSLLLLLANPIGSAALSRMPNALASLAAWPVVSGLIFMFRSVGMAYNEVVVALLDEPGSSPNLRKFAYWLAGLTSLGLILITITPISSLWFDRISALSPELAELAKRGLWFALPLPAINVFQSWYQGVILFGRRTRPITESMVIYLIINSSIQLFGILWGEITGLFVGVTALTVGILTQTSWLGFRAIPLLRALRKRDQTLAVI